MQTEMSGSNSREFMGTIALGILIGAVLTFSLLVSSRRVDLSAKRDDSSAKELHDQLVLSKTATSSDDPWAVAPGMCFLNFDLVSPIELLNKAKSIRSGPEFRTGIAENWIKLSDVRKLALRLDSTEPCPHVLCVLSSDNADDYSTEGVQAAQMIHGYMRGKYPGYFGSEKEMLLDVRAWLRERKIPTH